MMKSFIAFFVFLHALVICADEQPTSAYFTAIEESEAMKALKAQGNIIISVAHTKTMGCQGCYQFEISYEMPEESEIKRAIFYTRDTLFGDGAILVFQRNEKRIF
jgi:hypothetical protein